MSQILKKVTIYQINNNKYLVLQIFFRKKSYKFYSESETWKNSNKKNKMIKLTILNLT